MSLIRVRRTATLDSEAKDIQLPFIITFNNGKKEFREGYSEEEVRRRFDKSVAALYGGIKSVKLEDEDRRNGKDSIADKEREYTRLYELAQKNITFHAAKGDSAKVAEWKRKADEYKRLAQEDSRAMDAKFKVGDRVKYTGHTPLVYGKTGSVGTIKSVDTTLFADGYPLYEVEFSETRYGMTDTIGEEHLRRV